MGDDITELLLRYRARTQDRAARPEGARPVHLVAFGHPLSPTYLQVTRPHPPTFDG